MRQLRLVASLDCVLSAQYTVPQLCCGTVTDGPCGPRDNLLHRIVALACQLEDGGFVLGMQRVQLGDFVLEPLILFEHSAGELIESRSEAPSSADGRSSVGLVHELDWWRLLLKAQPTRKPSSRETRQTRPPGLEWCALS